MNQETYFLIADPRTGKVVRRSRMSLSLKEIDLVPLRVDKGVWKTYRAGDEIIAAKLPTGAMERWIHYRSPYCR